MIGKKFTNLLVVSKSEKPRYWACLCICGTEKVVRSDHLVLNKTKSCGCMASALTAERNKKSAKHGKSISPTYKSWQSMRTRCMNPNSDQFPDYGARGITVCSRWNSFALFFLDMGERPAGTTIDRIDNSKGYSPENCKWATMTEQENNKRNNVVFEFGGKIQTLSMWSRETGIGYQTLRKRVDAGWQIPEVFTRQVQIHKPSKN